MPALEPHAQEDRVGAGDEHRAQHPVDRVRLDRLPGARGDRPRHRIGLLRGEAPVFDAVRRQVAGGVDIGDAVDASERVDRHEPVAIGRDAHDGWAEQLGSASTRSTRRRRSPGLMITS